MCVQGLVRKVFDKSTCRLLWQRAFCPAVRWPPPAPGCSAKWLWARWTWQSGHWPRLGRLWLISLACKFWLCARCRPRLQCGRAQVLSDWVILAARRSHWTGQIPRPTGKSKEKSTQLFWFFFINDMITYSIKMFFFIPLLAIFEL